MKYIASIAILSLILGFILGHFVLPQKVPETISVIPPEVQDSISVLEDTIVTLNNRIDSLENVLSSIPEPPPAPPPVVIKDTVRIEVSRAVLDSLAFYKKNYPILFKKYSLLKEENLLLKKNLEARGRKINFLENQLKQVQIELQIQKSRVSKMRKLMVLVGVVAFLMGKL